MMTNLFSSFDPTTSISTSINWCSTILGLMMIPPTFWMTPSRISTLLMMLYYKLNMEFKITMAKTNTKTNIMMMSMFMFIFMNNMLGLLPYTFTSSSHMVFSLSMSLPLWLALMIYGWTNFTNKMFAHTLPMSTPVLLMPFMVCIETVSNLIRPLSLAVRLTANMIAGHLFMVLLGNLIMNSECHLTTFMFITQMLLMLFETGVSIIQAYVFTTLSTLYIKETAYETK